MLLSTGLFLLAFMVMGTVATLPQEDIDSIKVDPAHHKVIFENAQVRVVRWVVLPGDKTLRHTHPTSLNINLTDYNGRVTAPGAESFDMHDKAGSLSWRQAGMHVVENIGAQRMEGIIVEPKRPASARPAGSPDPIVVDARHQKVEFENEQVRVLRERNRGEHVPLHGHPDSVQVLLTDLNTTVTTAGGAERVTGKAGEARWRPATQHSADAPEPFEQIVIEMKGVPTATLSRN